MWSKVLGFFCCEWTKGAGDKCKGPSVDEEGESSKYRIDYRKTNLSINTKWI